jgi:hypothetical protein
VNRLLKIRRVEVVKSPGARVEITLQEPRALSAGSGAVQSWEVAYVIKDPPGKVAGDPELLTPKA